MEFVIARFKEPKDWIIEMASLGAQVTLYDKGGVPEVTGSDNIQLVYLPNIGREADTYIKHICSRYYSLSDLTVFLQGDPWPHMKIPRSYKRTGAAMLNIATTDCDNSTQPFVCNNILTEAKPPKFHMRVNVQRAARKLLGEAYIRTTYKFAAGAQYIVSKETILAHPLEFWERARDLIEKDEINAWEIERLWMYIFGLVA